MTDLAPWLIGALALLAGAWRLVRFGEEREKTRTDGATIDTVERIQDAKRDAAAGGAGWHERLRQTRD